MQFSSTMQVTEYYFEETHKMHGVKRVLVFCIMIVILPATLIIVPLYLRKTVFADVTYPVAESDIIEIRDGISSIFCQQHSLHMSTNFNAFQLSSKPEISTNRKHIRLKKSMTLPDDTLEYWGFFLLKGAKVHLKFCSRYDGSRLLVVKGQRNLKTCDLLDHNTNKLGANFAQGHEQVKVFFEDITEIAENIPVDEVEKKISQETSTNDKKNNMEIENHAGEDLSDGDYNYNDSVDTSTSSTTTTKRPRKKLKKGTLHTARNNRNEDISNNANHLTTNNIDHITTTKSSSDSSITTTNRQRRHHSANKHSTTTVAQPVNKTVHRRHLNDSQQRKQQVYDQLYKQRNKREQVYDRKYSHGGNAINFTETDESNSISSFETGLFECYNGDILLAEGFAPTPDCINAHFLENGSHRMLSKHQITEDGYYYYIFYSDNDLVRNDIHAIFDIYKPTFQYSNVSDAQGCVNATNCTFSIGFLSDEIVVVEVPTRDGIEHEEDDITYLISTCHPRTEIYAIFPIMVLILILSCSFI
ncbi:uncharacterized protein LOC119688030 isoform X2 [Teleopsis dalmanni]|uniref:uncharacterized protein LOC119688030 isoform X2 n=1 Tax=Teleopsis dalmanni TaxID=139649 RepID=UPI0018CEB098|nr:uncharacterized protein LOC119688030 isoform X2 [Teleopsis dalmanni]